MADYAGGWDTGAVYSSRVYAGEPQDHSREDVDRKFASFLRSFRLDNIFVYREQLRQNLILGNHFLEVDMAHIVRFDEQLASHMKVRPKEYLPIFEDAVRKVATEAAMGVDDVLPRFQIMLISRANPVPIRDLDTPFISKLVRVAGIVISANSLQSKATSIQITCRSCRHTKNLDVDTGLAGVSLPMNCEAAPDPINVRPQCPRDPYVVLNDRSTFVDMQMLKLQEPHSLVPVGELPRHLILCVDRYLTGKVTPGMRVTVTGIFDIFSHAQAQSKKGTGAAVALRSPYIQVCGIQLDPDANGSKIRTFTAAEEDEFLQMSRRPNLYNEFTSSIAPQIFGSDDIKKAITCLLFGGSKKFLPDGMRLRGDINVLMLGDPGTAKSQLLKFVEKVAPIAVYTSGKGSSAAGLTASVIRDPSTREFRLEAGAMVLADGGVVCIDEFDKMRDEDRVAIHEAMEQQTISIAKAGITTILNSRTSVLAAANPVFGRYDDMKTPGDNIDFQSTILSRFDLIFIIRDEHDEARDSTIARHVVGVHMNTKTSETVEGDFDIQKMRSYISYCKTLSVEAAEKLSSHFVEMREKIRALDSGAAGNAKTAIPITVRQLEAIIRISESLAKMTLSVHANERHVDEAIRLFNASTMNAIQSGIVEGSNLGKFSAEVSQVQDVILRRFPVGSQMSATRLVDELMKQDFSENAVNKAIFKLSQKEVLKYEERRTRLRRVRV